MRLLLVGILGGLVATAIMAGGGAALGRVGSSGLVAWVGLFGVLGWNFISQVVHPAAGQQGTSGWLISGVVFWLLAAGGLVPLLSGLVSDLRSAGRPDPVVASMQPLVRAQFMPANWGGQSGSGTAADGLGAVGGSGSFGSGSASMSVPSAMPVPSAMSVPSLGPGQAAVARNPSAASIGLWVVLIVAGALLGAVASSALISALQ